MINGFRRNTHVASASGENVTFLENLIHSYSFLFILIHSYSFLFILIHSYSFLFILIHYPNTMTDSYDEIEARIQAALAFISREENSNIAKLA